MLSFNSLYKGPLVLPRSGAVRPNHRDDTLLRDPTSRRAAQQGDTYKNYGSALAVAATNPFVTVPDATPPPTFGAEAFKALADLSPQHLVASLAAIPLLSLATIIVGLYTLYRYFPRHADKGAIALASLIHPSLGQSLALRMLKSRIIEHERVASDISYVDSNNLLQSFLDVFSLRYSKTEGEYLLKSVLGKGVSIELEGNTMRLVAEDSDLFTNEKKQALLAAYMVVQREICGDVKKLYSIYAAKLDLSITEPSEANLREIATELGFSRLTEIDIDHPVADVISFEDMKYLVFKYRGFHSPYIDVEALSNACQRSVGDWSYPTEAQSNTGYFIHFCTTFDHDLKNRILFAAQAAYDNPMDLGVAAIYRRAAVKFGLPNPRLLSTLSIDEVRRKIPIYFENN